jgi:S-adenosylmethionine synthetase
MVKNLTLTASLVPSEERIFEAVERKGIGHPDTLADGIAEAISIDYSNYCLNKFGLILHQTLDKILVMGGLGKFDFGVGEVVKPWRIILNGRLSESFGNKKIPIKEIEISAAKKFLKSAVPRLNLENGVEFIHYTSCYSKNPRWFRPLTSEDVPDATKPYSNDTSTCAGYWPLSLTERLSLLLEAYFYDSSGFPKFSYIGQDIKIMAVRRKKEIDVTMCVPFFSADIKDWDDYYFKKSQIYKELKELANNYVKGNYTINLFMNTQDEKARNSKRSIGLYFVTSGSALDSGEEGLVGRGNRSRGVISNIRPLNMEAVCGKNPVYYVGKIYTYLADKIAKEISETLECECNTYISSRNSDDLLKPYNVLIETTKKRPIKKINLIVEKHLQSRLWTKDIVENKVFLPAPGCGHQYKTYI